MIQCFGKVENGSLHREQRAKGTGLAPSVQGPLWEGPRAVRTLSPCCSRGSIVTPRRSAPKVIRTLVDATEQFGQGDKEAPFQKRWIGGSEGMGSTSSSEESARTGTQETPLTSRLRVELCELINRWIAVTVL